MKRDELLKQCRFFREGGENEEQQAYRESYDYLVCWTGERLWVSGDGDIGLDQEELKEIVSDLAIELPIGLRVYLCEAFLHFGNNRLLYEDRPALIRALRDKIFPFYLSSQGSV
jgi:hypothetical protein